MPRKFLPQAQDLQESKELIVATQSESNQNNLAIAFAKRGDWDIAASLANGDISARDKNGQTFLHIAVANLNKALTNRDHTAVIKRRY